MRFPSVPVMGYHVYSGSPDEIKLGGETTVINTLNAYSYVTAERDEVFKTALKSSEILVADGFPVVIAARLLGGYRIRKIAGEDVFYLVLRHLNGISGSCFFLGSTEDTLGRIRKRLSVEFPNITMHCFSPPFKSDYSEEENRQMIDAIRDCKPFAVFVGMTAPKQEKWVFANKDAIDANVICSIGAVFDFYAGTVKRPAPIWVKLNLEWLIRFIKEPGRLGKRYFVYSPLFFKYLFKYVLIRLKSGSTSGK
jgi:N-acetylglucosaminyldiphosphoundecaprenol N-acetyl-beta-D-mannosaminyltransferase